MVPQAIVGQISTLCKKSFVHLPEPALRARALKGFCCLRRLGVI
jgi:hypothetical protein